MVGTSRPKCSELPTGASFGLHFLYLYYINLYNLQDFGPLWPWSHSLIWVLTDLLIISPQFMQLYVFVYLFIYFIYLFYICFPFTRARDSDVNHRVPCGMNWIELPWQCTVPCWSLEPMGVPMGLAVHGLGYCALPKKTMGTPLWGWNI